MLYQKNGLLFYLLIISLHAFSQAKVTQDYNIWLGYLTQAKVSENFSVWNDFHWVPESFSVARTGLTYHFNNSLNITTTLGYGYLWIFPQGSKKTIRPEHRPWGQTTASHKNRDFTFFHRVRYEGRFRGKIIDDTVFNEFNFNFRFRYLFQMRYNLTQQPEASGKWFAMVSDEILFNVGHEIKNNFRMDQNRVSLGFGYQIKNTVFQTTYMNQLIESNTSNTFRINHHLQILVFHTFDFIKKTTSP